VAHPRHLAEFFTDIQASFLGDDWADSLAATGNSSQANGYAITKAINRFDTVTNGSADSATLPSVANYKGSWIFIRNDGAGTLKVYPSSGQFINSQAADAKQDLATGSGRVYFKTMLYLQILGG
jgi:hypothetical protein